MATFNQYTCMGNLGKDPEMSYTASGKAVTRFSVAVNQGKDSQGKDHPAMWLNIICWDTLAERMNDYLHKGSRVFLQGRLGMRPYKDKNNVDRTALEVVATTVQLLDKKPSTPEGSSDPLSQDDETPF